MQIHEPISAGAQPRPSSTGARIAAGIAGTAAAIGALYMLLSDAIASGAFTTEQKMAPLVVVVTITAGHLVGTAIRGRRILSTLGFATLFAVGTTITIVGSVGRNASSIEGRHLAADAVNIQRRDELKALARNRAMLAEAEGRVSANCADGDGKLCKGAKATVAVYTDAIKGNLATLKDIGPEVAEDQTARKVGEVVALMGGDAARTTALVDTFRPFILSLFAELTAIVAFGFALGHGHAPQRRAKPSPAPATTTTMTTKMTVIDPVAPVARKLALRVVARREPIALPAPTAGKFADWLSTIPAGTEVAGTQRDLACKAGIALSALQRGLERAHKAGSIHVVVANGTTKVVKMA